MGTETFSSQYDPVIVRQVLFEEIIELHPQRLTIAELARRIASDPIDGREIGTASEAISDLRRAGLVRYRNDDQVVEPTHAAFEAVKVLAR
jgi:predicted transcriptional regulator